MDGLDDDPLDADLLWLRELAADLVERLERYLECHAAFEAWLAAREGDRRDQG